MAPTEELAPILRLPAHFSCARPPAPEEAELLARCSRPLAGRPLEAPRFHETGWVAGQSFGDSEDTDRLNEAWEAPAFIRDRSPGSKGLEATVQELGVPDSKPPSSFARVVRNVLDAECCAELIASANAKGFAPYLLRGSDGKQRLKLEELDSNHIKIESAELAAWLFEALRPYLPPRVDDDWHLIGLNEQFRFLCYTPGQVFPAHYDGCLERPAGHPQEGSRSHMTATLYLNDVPEHHGGATNFLDHGHCSVKHQPEAGSVLIFTQDLYHEGQRLTQGLKYNLRTEVFYSKSPLLSLPAPLPGSSSSSSATNFLKIITPALGDCGSSLSLTGLEEILSEAAARGFEYSFPCFVETGAGLGDTVIPLADRFRRVQSIDPREECVLVASLRSWRTEVPVRFHWGMSPEVLDDVLPRLTGPTVFLLNGHSVPGSEDVLQQELVRIDRSLSHAAVVIFGPGVSLTESDRSGAKANSALKAIADKHLRLERVSCAFSTARQRLYVVCLQPVTMPFIPTPTQARSLATWVATPGKPPDEKGLAGLRDRGPDWAGVANLISLEWANGGLSHQEEHRSGVLGVGAPRRLSAEQCYNAKANTAPLGAVQQAEKPQPKVVMTREQANEMQDELIVKFGDAAFQERLRAARDAAGSDPILWMKARMELCLPVQAAIISKYGFSASRKGVAQSVFTVRSLFGEDEDVMHRSSVLNTLVNPS